MEQKAFEPGWPGPSSRIAAFVQKIWKRTSAALSLKPGRYRSRQRIIGPVACRRVRYPAHGPLNAPPLAFVIREVQHLRYDTRHQKC